MKQLSIEQKAKAYDEAIKRANELLYVSDKDSLQRKTVEHIFSELKESEGEGIRKALIKSFNEYLKQSEEAWGKDVKFKYVNVKDAIAWLEKQGEQKDILEDAILDSNEKQDEKSANKVEPKFKAGDWIVFNGLTLCVRVVVNGFYVTTSRDGVTNSYDCSIDNAARLWTIKDAKDGDVLATSRYILIFEKFLPKDGAVSYCHYDFDSSTPHFDFNKDDNWYFGQEAKVYPATKEQRDILFQKMKDAGYTFDFEKKELKKIEQKPTEWHREDEQNLNACLGYISDEFLRRWLKDIIHAKYDKTTCSEEDKKNFEPKFKVGDIT